MRSLLLVLLVAACASKREERSAEELAKRRAELVAGVRRERDEIVARFLERLDHDPDSPFDVLVLSGGGPYGAFGAGVLLGWGERRPEFDMVSGISVGALIAPYAFLNEQKDYEHLYAIFSNPDEDWANFKPLMGNLWGTAFFDNDGLVKLIESQVDADFVERIAQAARRGKLLLVGATNIDHGMLRVWDLSEEAQRGEAERIRRILLASSAIPVVFPPVEIDGELYVDGGATISMFMGTDAAAMRRVRDEFRRRRPDKPLPPIRVWVIVNHKLTLDSTTVQPKWSKLAMRSFWAVNTTAMVGALELFRARLARINRIEGIRTELRFVAIPSDYTLPDLGTTIFDAETMRPLAELGRKMGADPASWRTRTPDPVWPVEIQ